MGEELGCLSPLPQLLSSSELGEGIGHLLWNWSPQGGRKTKRFHTALSWTHHPSENILLPGQVPILFLDLLPLAGRKQPFLKETEAQSKGRSEGTQLGWPYPHPGRATR